MGNAESTAIEIAKSIIKLADEVDDLKTLDYMVAKLSLFILYYTDAEKIPVSFIDLAEYVEFLRKDREDDLPKDGPTVKYIAKLRKEFEDM